MWQGRAAAARNSIANIWCSGPSCRPAKENPNRPYLPIRAAGTMALAAVYGGPVFNVLVAWSAPTLYAALRHGAMAYQLSPGVGILVVFTLAVLCLQLAAIPLLRWRLDRRAAAAVLALFVLAQAFFVSKELL